MVDRPANPDCTFSMIKRSDDDIPSRDDPLSKDVSLMRKIVESLDKKILSKRQISSLKDKDFALIRKNGATGNIERLFPIPDKPHAKALLKQIMSLDVTDQERHKIHEIIKNVLGAKHGLIECNYCKGYIELLQKGGGDQVMDREKLEQAKALIEELLAEAPVEGSEVGEMDPNAGGTEEEFEGQEGDDSLGAETENIVDSPEKDETEDVPELQGSGYSDKEGADTWEGDEGYEVGLTNDEERTHLYDSEAERGEKDELEGGDCPYCGSTVKALMSGKFRKSSAVCPGCKVEYSVGAHPKVSIVAKGGRTVRKASSNDDLVVDTLGRLAKAVGILGNKVSKMEGTPQPRKFAKKVEKYAGASDSVEGEDLKKSMPDGLKSDMDKAVAISKSARAESRDLKPNERAFCDSVLERSLDFKVGGNKG